jgi:hypothetical protein
MRGLTNEEYRVLELCAEPLPDAEEDIDWEPYSPREEEIMDRLRGRGLVAEVRVGARSTDIVTTDGALAMRIYASAKQGGAR